MQINDDQLVITWIQFCTALIASGVVKRDRSRTFDFDVLFNVTRYACPAQLASVIHQIAFFDSIPTVLLVVMVRTPLISTAPSRRLRLLSLRQSECRTQTLGEIDNSKQRPEIIVAEICRVFHFSGSPTACPFETGRQCQRPCFTTSSIIISRPLACLRYGSLFHPLAHLDHVGVKGFICGAIPIFPNDGANHPFLNVRNRSCRG